MSIISPLPYTLQNGATADASQVMADLNEIFNDVNANAAPLASPTFTGTLNGAAGIFSATLTATAFIPTGSTVPANGVYLPAANNIGFAANSALQFNIQGTASAVNYIVVQGGAAGNNAAFSAVGADAAIGVSYSTKGIGAHLFKTGGGSQVQINNVASAVNTLALGGSATGTNISISAIGSDSNIGIDYLTKGTGHHTFKTSGGVQLDIIDTASAVNYIVVQGGAAGNNAAFSAVGADAAIGISYSVKSTGVHTFKTGGGTQFTIQDTASAVNNLTVQGGATGTNAAMSAIGSDTDIGITLACKGAGVLVCAAVNGQTTASAANVNVDGSGNLKKSTSSRRYKKDIRTYDGGLDKVLAMRPVLYKSMAESDGSRDYAGFIAEEIEEIGLNEFVAYDKEGRPDHLYYPHMMALMANAIKELSGRIDSLTKG